MRQDWVDSRKRAMEIVQRFDGGASVRELSGIYHLSYMRVHQIVTKAKGQTLRAMRRSVKVNAH